MRRLDRGGTHFRFSRPAGRFRDPRTGRTGFFSCPCSRIGYFFRPGFKCFLTGITADRARNIDRRIPHCFRHARSKLLDAGGCGGVLHELGRGFFTRHAASPFAHLPGSRFRHALGHFTGGHVFGRRPGNTLPDLLACQLHTVPRQTAQRGLGGFLNNFAGGCLAQFL